MYQAKASSSSSSSSSHGNITSSHHSSASEVNRITTTAATDYFELNTESAERRVWLVKLPDFVFNRISDLEEVEDEGDGGGGGGDELSSSFGTKPQRKSPGPRIAEDNGGIDIGTVRIYPPSGDKPAQVLVMLDEEGPCGDLPREYELKFLKLQPNQQIHLLSQDEPSGRLMAIEGRVEQECHLRPMLTGDYRQVLQNRMQQLNRPSRTVQYVDAFASPVGLGLPKYVNESVLVDKWKRRTGTDPMMRRDRLPQEELLNLLFHLFERQTHWTLQQLVDQTKQPVQYLKETLGQMAIYNVRGPYKNLYELRSEYARKK